MEPNIEFTFAPLDGRPSVRAGPSIPGSRPGVRRIFPVAFRDRAGRGVVTWHLGTAGLAWVFLDRLERRARGTPIPSAAPAVNLGLLLRFEVGGEGQRQQLSSRFCARFDSVLPAEFIEALQQCGFQAHVHHLLGIVLLNAVFICAHK